jgi:hypothetical protein
MKIEQLLGYKKQKLLRIRIFTNVMAGYATILSLINANL